MSVGSTVANCTTSHSELYNVINYYFCKRLDFSPQVSVFAHKIYYFRITGHVCHNEPWSYDGRLAKLLAGPPLPDRFEASGQAKSRPRQ